MPDKTTRRIVAEQAETEHERLQIVLNQGLDEWLRAYIVGQFKNISAQPDDPTAVDRALKGARSAIAAWKRGRAQIAALPDDS
jgi:hypothetical protein